MRSASSLLCVLSFTAIAYGLGYPERHRQLRRDDAFTSTCKQIAGAISSQSAVYFPNDNTPNYAFDNAHYFLSSSQSSSCSVEPGSTPDVSKILSILGKTRTPFAITGGGCATNPGFSSTQGVQISMRLFDEIKVDQAAGTVELGAGLTSGVVYKKLEPLNINVMAPSDPNVGIAGSTLGGGYGLMSNQYGLAIDNLVRLVLVMPNGTIKSVTSADKDLWFAVRGGGNNFGIVTKFVFKFFQQKSNVWGGYIIYQPNETDAVGKAVENYQGKEDDPNASASFILRSSKKNPDITVIARFFYGTPTPPQGLFDDFLSNITYAEKNISSRSYLDLVTTLGHLEPTSSTDRGRFSGLSVEKLSPAVFNASVNVTKMWVDRINIDHSLTIDTVLQNVGKTVFDHGSDSAWPPDRTNTLLPIVVKYTWADPQMDKTVDRTMRKHTDYIQTHADVSKAAVYVNDALHVNISGVDTPLEDIYGDNLPTLRKIRAEFDPDNVMGLTGGLKIF